MTEMAPVAKSPVIDLTEWNFGFGDFNPAVAKIFTESLDGAFKEEPPRARLPIQWAPNSDGAFGPEVADPLTIYFQLPLGQGCEGPEWQITLNELTDDMMDDYCEDGSFAVGVLKFRDALQGLLRRIDAKLETPTATTPPPSPHSNKEE